MMKTLLNASMLASAILVAGCATEGPATNGASVRAIVASQTVAPQPRHDAGSDARAAVSAYKNYQGSYATPVSQNDSSSFGRR